MSQNHLRGDKESQYRKTGVGAKYNNSSDYQQRPLSGGSGSGPGTASSISSNASASRSFKKRNNAQVWIALKNSGPVNPSSDPNPTTTARHVENGSHVKSTVTGESQKPAAAATPKPADALRQKSSQPVPKAPSSLTASMASDSTSSTTPSKGDAGKGFSLQFGSISPGFMNVPARTSSAPPNLDEQQRNQALRTASKASPPNPAPTAPKQQTPNSDVPTKKPTTQGSRKTPLMGTSPAPPVQTQKPGVLPVPGTSMSMPFTQPNNPLPFGGPNTQIPSHVIRPNSPQMPLPIGNSSQVQQPLYVPRYTQHHIMQNRAKERRLKAILNKLTPQNFYKVFEQVKEVKIDNVITLTGLVSQIFDKALMEPTFCEMYCNFCQHLASELPELSVDNQKITFRRLLLNKCQEEFERGEREEEEVNKDEGETKQTDQEREEKRLKVRRRMLGNIRLIGELYKKRMLTERVMHECIKKLLGNYQNADEENIEALCKLMSTIGEMIDHPKAKEHMDAYFDIMRQLSNDMKLSSRVRFMLRDTIDLRKNRWQQRRKVEGPKKIEEVHRAAAQERLGQGGGSSSRLTRGPSMNSATRRGPPMEYAPRSSVLSSPVGGGFRGLGPQFRGQDSRVDDKGEFENRTLSVPLLQRSSGDEPVFGPQGGLGRRMSTTRQQPSASVGPTADNSSSQGHVRREVGGLNGYNNSQGDLFPKQAVPGANAYAGNQVGNSNATQKGSSEKVYPEERLREMSMAAIKEYYSAKDVVEAELCIKELNAPNFYPTLISMWVSDALERKDMERNVLAKLLVALTKSQEHIFNQQQLIQGFESLLTVFEDTVTDAPKAPEYLGRMFGTLILEDVLPLQDVCRLIHQGGEEPGRLREVGLAADVLGSILEAIKAEKGDATLKEIRTSSNLRLQDYLPPEPLKSRKLEMFL